MKKFDVPLFYRSPIIGKIKDLRKAADPRKKDFAPCLLDFGNVQFLIPRHFGFCYGVENAIEIAYKTIENHPDKRIYLLSEMIHNPEVNQDLLDRGVRFIMDTKGGQLIPWDELSSEDIVIVPAFGTTVEIEELLAGKGIDIKQFNATCPFVERVWKMSSKLGDKDYTILIHGKHNHEETRATFSHSQQFGPALILKDMAEAKKLAMYIRKEKDLNGFYEEFEGRYSEGFDAEKNLSRMGVVNQTTMLATETRQIAEFVKQQVIGVYGEENWKEHFADTRDSLCYATSDNQNATYGLLEENADLALVVGGYNSSNTTHLAELCEEKVPTYFVNNESKLLSDKTISHFDFHNKQEMVSEGYLPKQGVNRIILTSGASCPDSTVDRVLQQVLAFYPGHRSVEEVMKEVELKYSDLENV